MAKLTESSILHENGIFWILHEKSNVFTVMKNRTTHSVSVQSFNELSIAKAYCDYLFKQSKLNSREGG